MLKKCKLHYISIKSAQQVTVLIFVFFTTVATACSLSEILENIICPVFVKSHWRLENPTTFTIHVWK